MNKKEKQAQKPQIRQPAQVPGLPSPPVRHYRQAAGWLLLTHAALVIILHVMVREWAILGRVFSENTLEAFVLAGVLTQFLLVLLPAFLILLLYRPPAYDLAGGKARAGSLVLAATVGIPAAVVFQGLNNLLIYVLVRSGINLPAPAVKIGFAESGLPVSPLPVLLLIILIAAIIPGISEEIMFRGVLQASLHSTGSMSGAVIWQAIAFALFHADPLFILPPLLAGLLLGYIRLKSESLLPAILAHISLNLSLLALQPLLPRLTAPYIASGTSQAYSLLYASLIAACVAAVAFVPLLVLLGQHKESGRVVQARQKAFVLDWQFLLGLLVLSGSLLLRIRS